MNIPKSIKILIDRLAFDTSWELYSREKPGEAFRPMQELLQAVDFMSKQNIEGCIEALQVKQLVQMPKIYKSIMFNLQQRLTKTIEIYFAKEVETK